MSETCYMRAAHWKYRTQNIVKKSPSEHHRATLSGYIFALKARIDNRKKTQLTENTGCKTDAKNSHLGTIAQLCRAISSQLRHMSTIGKKLVKQHYLLHMSSQYGEVRQTSGWGRSASLGHPCKFNGIRILAALLHGTRVIGVSQTLRRWTKRSISAGRSSCWALVIWIFKKDKKDRQIKSSLYCWYGVIF